MGYSYSEVWILMTDLTTDDRVCGKLFGTVWVLGFCGQNISENR